MSSATVTASHMQTEERQSQPATDIPNKKSGAELVPSSTFSTIRPLCCSNWLDLPAELFLSVCCFLPSHCFLLALLSVHRRQYSLIQGSAGNGTLSASGQMSASAPSSTNGSFAHSLFCRDLPSAVLTVDELCSHVEVDVDDHTVELFARDDPSSVPRVLASLRDVLECSVVLMANRGASIDSRPVLLTCLHTLSGFAQLTSLSLYLECTFPYGQPARADPVLDALAISLESLHQLEACKCSPLSGPPTKHLNGDCSEQSHWPCSVATR